jgi:hypothetical protein
MMEMKMLVANMLSRFDSDVDHGQHVTSLFSIICPSVRLWLCAPLKSFSAAMEKSETNEVIHRMTSKGHTDGYTHRSQEKQ